MQLGAISTGLLFAPNLATWLILAGLQITRPRARRNLRKRVPTPPMRSLDGAPGNTGSTGIFSASCTGGGEVRLPTRIEGLPQVEAVSVGALGRSLPCSRRAA